jgi:hypothetical protein
VENDSTILRGPMSQIVRWVAKATFNRENFRIR